MTALIPNPVAPATTNGFNDDSLTTDGFTSLGGQPAYQIAQADRMPPFLMSIVSDCDIWMFVSSTGGITCGRLSPERALFPYETDDRLHHLYGTTGPITLMRVRRGTLELKWEPFAGIPATGTIRRLYKTLLGHQLVFEERHEPLGLLFRYTWKSSKEFGVVRAAELENIGEGTVDVELLDGLLNVLPACVPMSMQQGSSCLLDAYKLSELDAEVPLAVYALNSRITDRAEPSECLRASAVWTSGLPSARLHLSDRAIEAFRRNEVTPHLRELRGQRGNFLLQSQLRLEAGETASWNIVADTHLSQSQVASLRRRLQNPTSLSREVADSVERGGQRLRAIIASCDGLQSTARQELTAHHLASTLFNAMRGGVFVDNGRIRAADFIAFATAWNKPLAHAHAALLASLPEHITRSGLAAHLAKASSPSLSRLADEYLPLTFGRRHGDPSRPWNMFAIRIAHDDGTPSLTYQGNWRDIFQNWESLCISFPEYLPSIIAKFVNASTIDGFNPYRISRDGVDWEVPEPHNPWSNIGYWGDHQLIYLLRLLEATDASQPGTLDAMLVTARFAYANVPYRLKRAEELFADPRKAIDFDDQAEAATQARVADIGADGRLSVDASGHILHVTLAEKLLVPVLSKLGCFVPGGGIWMNTQRPEWNDANNALAGHGLSVVTLCYLRRTLGFLQNLFGRQTATTLHLSTEVADWLTATAKCLSHKPTSLDDAQRLHMTRTLSHVFSDYRWRVYHHGLSNLKPIPHAAVLQFISNAIAWVDSSIREQKRTDGLYHGYNVMAISPDRSRARVARLAEMLEGQVAVLSSGILNPAESLAVLEAMFASKLYVSDRDSFVLYPDKKVPGFLDKNGVPAAAAKQIPLLAHLLASKDHRVILSETPELLRFAPDLRNSEDLEAALTAAAAKDSRARELLATDRQAVLDLYEQTFDHHSFTGRSGSMFGYEGLGCIYWHMVAKLLLAVQEVCHQAIVTGSDATLIARLAEMYHRVRRGFGFNKSARQYGAFPTDPYSHTPAHSGARQPGMTGQVKEEMLTRFGELGVSVLDGKLHFAPRLLEIAEFHKRPDVFEYVSLGGREESFNLAPGQLAFTICQVLVVYRLADQPGLQVITADGQSRRLQAACLDLPLTQSIFARQGTVTRIEVDVVRSKLLA